MPPISQRALLLSMMLAAPLDSLRPVVEDAVSRGEWTTIDAAVVRLRDARRHRRHDQRDAHGHVWVTRELLPKLDAGKAS